MVQTPSEVAGMVVGKNDKLSSGGGLRLILMSLSDDANEDMNVVTGVTFQSTGMLAWSGGYLLNAGGQMETQERQPLIAHGTHPAAPRVYQQQTSVVRSTFKTRIKLKYKSFSIGHWDGFWNYATLDDPNQIALVPLSTINHCPNYENYPKLRPSRQLLVDGPRAADDAPHLALERLVRERRA